MGNPNPIPSSWAQQPPYGVHIVNSTQNPPLIRLWDLHIPSYPLLFEELIRIYENPSSHFLIYWTWFCVQIFLDEKIFSWMKKYFLSFFHFQILTSPASVTGSRESYLLVSVISWVRLQSGNSQKPESALHTLQFQIRSLFSQQCKSIVSGNV